MTRKPKEDWADKMGVGLADYHAVGRSHVIARALRTAYRRGAKDEREATLSLIAEWWPHPHTEEIRISGDPCVGMAMDDLASVIRARGGKR